MRKGDTETENPAWATPRSADRILRVLEVLAADHAGQSLATLSRETETPKSSLLNLLRALVQNGYADHSDGIYQLGSNSYRLASAILSRRQWPETALPVLRRLADSSGESAMISEIAPGGDDFVYIAKVESRQALRFAGTVGDRRPLYATAGGIALLMQQPDAEVRAYLDRTTFHALTPKTRTDRAEIEAEIGRVKLQGYCETTSGSTLGLSAVAAPIPRVDAPPAAVVLGVPTERYHADRARLVALTRAAAEEISAIMGALAP